MLQNILEDDLNECFKVLEGKDTQFGRRAAFRAFFAAVEGSIQATKEAMLHQQRRLNGIGFRRFRTAEEALLREETYGLDRHGNVVVSPRFLRTDENLIFLMRLMSSRVTISKSLALDGWRCFRASLKVRHRLTHPKSARALAVTDRELKELEDAAVWFYETFSVSLLADGRRMQRTGKRLEKETARAQRATKALRMHLEILRGAHPGLISE
jgi:hypothetical protein